MVPFLWHAVLRKTASVRSSNKQNILLFYPIVTPYKQQEKFIKNQLVKKGINSGSTIESKNPNDIEVGSVDKYQVIRIHDFWFLIFFFFIFTGIRDVFWFHVIYFRGMKKLSLFIQLFDPLKNSLSKRNLFDPRKILVKSWICWRITFSSITSVLTLPLHVPRV